MNRDDALEFVKTRSPEETARAFNAQKIRRQHNGVTSCCVDPAHKDSTPSASWQLVGGVTLYNCHGCGLAGDVPALLQELHGYTFPEALDEAAAMFGVAIDDEEPRVPRPRPRLVEAEPEAPRIDWARFFGPMLTLGRLDGSTIAHDVEVYLDGRNLLHAGRAAGLAALPEHGWEVLVGAYGRDAVDAVKLLDGEGWARPCHRLLIPWFSFDGALATVQRRHLDQPGMGNPKCVSPRGPMPDSPFGAELLVAAPKDAPLVICEAPLDAIALRHLDPSSGRVVLASQGVRGWRWDHLAAGRDVLIGFDADDEGDAAATELGDRLRAVAVDVQRLRPRGAKDFAAILASRQTRAA